ncbi:MAG TPA: phosphate ABC transporter permease PstA [Chthonomonadales bacterium]|nr:phosphate ABC transporter permease PstA [Chthonomonadales bacterium]
MSRVPGNVLRRQLISRAMLLCCGLATTVTVSALLWVLAYLFVRGLPDLNWRTISRAPTPMGTPGGGLRNAEAGSLVLLTVASCIGIPLGVLGGIYQVESRGHFARAVRFLTDVLNSIPSIVIGLFVYIVVVIPIAQVHQGQGFSALAGGLALGLIMIPTIMRTTEEIVNLVPHSLRDASLALGATRLRTMVSVTLPAARAGIITAIMLAIARVAGETAPLLFTAFGNVAFSVRLDKPIDALPLSIFYNATSAYEYLHRQALAAALILLLLILGMSIFVRAAMRSRIYEHS